MENKYSEFKKINPFRRSSRVGDESNRMNKRRTNFPNRLGSETKPTLFSPPEVVDKEYKNEPIESNDSDVESSEERGSSFIDEFSSMLDSPSLSYSGSMDDIETSLWQEQEQDEGKEENSEQTEDEPFSTRSDYDERRNKRNPFINEFTAMLEEYSGNDLDEEESVGVTQDQENFTTYNPSQDEEEEQGGEHSFVNEFTAMLDEKQSVHQPEEETVENSGEAAINDSDDEGEDDTDSTSGSYEDEEVEEEDSFQNDFTSILEGDSAHEQSEEYTDEVNNEEDRNEGENSFKEEFTSMLEDGSSAELGDNEVEQPEQTNVEEDATDEHSEDFDQEDDENELRNLDEEEIDHNESLQQEMLSILEETVDGDETSLQFMEDVIEYFDEIEENRSFPLDRFLEILMNVYCSEESDHVIEIDDEESIEEEEKEDEKINEYHAEDNCLEDPSVIVKLPVTLANVKLEVDVLKEIDLHTSISSIKNIKWSVSSLKSKVLLPSSTVFFKGVLVVEVEFEGQDTKNSIQSIQFPIDWEKSVNVTWIATPERSEEYEKEYTFDGNSRSMHLESYKKLAHEIEHDLKDVQSIWHYDVDKVNLSNRLQLKATVTLLIDLSQDQFLPIY